MTSTSFEERIEETKTMVLSVLEQQFKRVLSKIPAAVMVVTASSSDGIKRGVTCSSFTHISLRPPILSFAVNNPSRFHDIVVTSRLFAVHMLSSHQVVQSIHFAKRADDGLCQFDSIPHEMGPYNVPLIKDTAAIFLCEPHEHHTIGDHLVWYGRVVQIIRQQGDFFKEPLLYYIKCYRSIADDSFMSAFEQKTLPFELWTHQAHLRMAWNYISTFGVKKGGRLIKDGIKQYNETNKLRIKHGYNETLTEFYISVVAEAIQRSNEKHKDEPEIGFDQFIEEQSHLMDRGLIFKYYSEHILSNSRAKTEFVPPDKLPLPIIDR